MAWLLAAADKAESIEPMASNLRVIPGPAAEEMALRVAGWPGPIAAEGVQIQEAEGIAGDQDAAAEIEAGTGQPPCSEKRGWGMAVLPKRKGNP